MALFLLLYLFVYSSLHLYFFHRWRGAFETSRFSRNLLTIWLVFLVAAPLALRPIEKGGYEATALFLSYVAYLWMGFIFLFSFGGLVMEVVKWSAAVLSRLGVRKTPSKAFPSARAMFLLPLFLSLCLVSYGYLEAGEVRKERLEAFSRFPVAGKDRFRVVQVSDLHVGMIVRDERLERIAAAIEEEKPDLLVSTGDLVDGQIDNLKGAVKILAGIKAPYGKYAVTGNHEYYAGLAQALEFTRRCGFVTLRGEGRMAAPGLYLAGIDDETLWQAGLGRGKGGGELLKEAPDGAFRILLKHRPVPIRGAAKAFDLQLSGHTHGGQIFPFSLFTSLLFPYHRGDYVTPEGMTIHVSRGTGTWGPPVRLWSPPEITVIDIRS